VIPTFIFLALHQCALPIENKGIATRDFIYIDDIVKGLIACALTGVPGETYNLASGQETSILELAHLINSISGNQAAIHYQSARDWDRSGRRYGETTKAKSTLNFEAVISIESGLRATIEWTRENLGLIKSCMAKHIRYVPEINGYLFNTREEKFVSTN
jgi:UDP-glucose 4-epimerase